MSRKHLILFIIFVLVIFGGAAAHALHLKYFKVRKQAPSITAPKDASKNPEKESSKDSQQKSQKDSPETSSSKIEKANTPIKKN